MNSIDVIQKMVVDLSSKYELLPNDLTISENKDGSISLMLRSKLLLRLHLQGKDLFLLTNVSYEPIISGLGFKSKKVKTTPNFVKVPISDLLIEGETIDLIEQIVSIGVQTYSEGDFGCCHRYIECSDNLKCTHPDKLYSNSCQYKRNLNNGKIFYGVNANWPNRTTI